MHARGLLRVALMWGTWGADCEGLRPGWGENLQIQKVQREKERERKVCTLFKACNYVCISAEEQRRALQS